MSAARIECRDLSKTYNGQTAVRNLSLEINPGEILSVVGPSGCGKTTTLRMIAGFEHPDEGTVSMNGRVLNHAGLFVPPEKRNIGVVFQDYALFPHLTVGQNVTFGLKNTPRREKTNRAAELLAMVGLEGMQARYPHELSGGERQRVALARALAPQPQLLLLDEPFSSLDADLRLQLREDVRRLLKHIGLTAVFVTHDQEEALFMGDRLAVMNAGRLQQAAHPETIFAHPANRFVAEFMGNANFLPGIVTPGGIQTEIGLVEQSLPLPEGCAVELAVRADDIGFDPDGRANGRILARHFKGVLNVYRVQLDSGLVLEAFQPHFRIFPEGRAVRIYPDAGHELACFYQGNAVLKP